MRRFVDREGRAWDVVLGRESWGSHVALFVPVRSGEIRQAPLHASGYDTAAQELDALTPERLQSLLDGSQPKLEET